jgi:outer membrane usher protein
MAQDQRAVLELIVNGVSAGETIVVLRGSDTLMRTASLVDAGLNHVDGRREVLGGQEMVSLASLAPQVTFSLDEANLQLTLKADPDLLGLRTRDLKGGAPAGLEFRNDTSGFINYSVNYRGGHQADLFTESAVSARGLLLYNSASVSNSATTRGLTSVTLDQRQQMRRWTFGDSLGYSGPLGGDAWLAGLTVSREFAIDPYFVRHPTLSLSTPIAVPSVMEVQVNGQVVSQEPVAPGRLDVQNLPLTLGRNNARIVVRDAFGGTQELSSTYYLTTSALAPGVHDYQYSIGFRREGVGTDSWDYRAPVALVRHRVGVTDTLTIGGRAELEPGLVNAGSHVNLRLPFGEVEAAASASRTAARWGAASLTSFSYLGRRIGGGGSFMLASPRYTTLTPQAGDAPATQANAFASTAVGPASITLQHTLSRIHEGISRARTSLLSTVRMNRQMEFSASVTYARDEKGRGREAYAGVTVLFGRASASVSHTRDGSGKRVAVDAQQPVPAGVGYGFEMRAESSDSDVLTGAARYQGAHGRYEVRQQNFGEGTQTTVSAMGALVGIGGGLYATRPVHDSFALIRVPGVEGVRGFASNQEIGKTSRNGELLVPDLQPYYGNTLDIADGDVPLQYSVPAVRRTLAPPYRGGAVALFEVEKIQRFVGRIQMDDSGQGLTPAYGDLTVRVGDQTFNSPVGGDGSFYFENLPPGKHPAVLQNGQDQCTFTLDVPASTAPMVKLGTIRCTPGDRE